MITMTRIRNDVTTYKWKHNSEGDFVENSIGRDGV